MAQNGYGIDSFLHSDGPPYLPSRPAIRTPYYSHPHSTSPASSPTSSSISSGTRSSFSDESAGDIWSQSSISSAPHDYGYDLPCEFPCIGCRMRYYPGSKEDWISHSISHFHGQPLPLRTMCTFCNVEFDCSRNPADVLGNWRRRMDHIAEHFNQYRRADGGEVNHLRPDFCTLAHMYHFRLMSEEDYAHATLYSERPYCANLHPLGYKSREMKLKEERESVASYDLEKEQRQMRRERERGSGRSKGKDKTDRRR